MLQLLRTASIFLMLLLGLALFASSVAVAQQNDPGNDPGGNDPPPNQAPQTTATNPWLYLDCGWSVWHI